MEIIKSIIIITASGTSVYAAKKNRIAFFCIEETNGIGWIVAKGDQGDIRVKIHPSCPMVIEYY